jgi:hypothetical protein
VPDVGLEFRDHGEGLEDQLAGQARQDLVDGTPNDYARGRYR